MSIAIAIGIKTGKSKGVTWTAPTISALSITTTSDTTQTITATIVGTDYDGVSYEYSTDGVTYTEKGTSATGTYNATGLTTGTLYYWRARVYKGTNYGSYSDVEESYLSSLLTGLIDFWKFDEASGDATGVKGNVLTNVNTATYIAGKNGNAVSLGAGNANKNLQINSTLGLNYNSPFTVSFWIKMLTSQDGRIFSIMFATNPGNYTYLKQTGPNLYTIDDVLLGGISTTNSTHVVITRNHTGNVINYYLNGVFAGTEASFVSNYSAQTQRISLGNFTGALYTAQVFEDFGIWDRILSLPEIKELHCAGAAKIYPFDNRKVIADDISYCWFTSPKSIYSSTAKKSWTGVVSITDMAVSYHSIVELDHTTGLAKIFNLAATGKDDHNEPGILIRASDNRLFSSYCEHAGGTIKYRVSTNPLDASAWGAEGSLDPNNPDGYTYANCFQVANGDIYIFYRDTDAGAQWAYVKSVDGGVNFGTDVIFSNKTYHRIAQDPNNKNIIHFLASHHANEYATSLQINHFYFNASTETFHLSDGTDVTANLPLTDAHETPIVLNTLPAGGWIEDIIVDSSGYPRVLLTYYPTVATPDDKYLYYSEWNGSAWSTPYQIHKSVSRCMDTGMVSPQIHYPPIACFDRDDPDRIFASKEVGAICELFVITRVASNSFTSVQKTFSSTYDQWRPISTNAPNLNVFWLNKIYYENYQNLWYEQLMCDTL